MINTDLKFLQNIYLQNEEAPDNQDVINRMVDLGGGIISNIEKKLVNYDVIFSVGEKEIKPFQIGIIVSYIHLTYTSYKNEIKMISLMDIDKISFVEKGTKSELILNKFTQSCFSVFMQKLQDYDEKKHIALRKRAREYTIKFDESFKINFESFPLKSECFDYFSIFKRISFFLYRRQFISDKKYEHINNFIDKRFNKKSNIEKVIDDESRKLHTYKINSAFSQLVMHNPYNDYYDPDNQNDDDNFEMLEEYVEDGDVDGIDEVQF